MISHFRGPLIYAGLFIIILSYDKYSFYCFTIVFILILDV